MADGTGIERMDGPALGERLVQAAWLAVAAHLAAAARRDDAETRERCTLRPRLQAGSAVRTLLSAD